MYLYQTHKQKPRKNRQRDHAAESQSRMTNASQALERVGPDDPDFIEVEEKAQTFGLSNQDFQSALRDVKNWTAKH
jgi:hypothetical protein